MRLTYLALYKAVQHTHSWSKHRVSKYWISAPPQTGDTQHCKMSGYSLFTFLHFTL